MTTEMSTKKQKRNTKILYDFRKKKYVSADSFARLLAVALRADLCFLIKDCSEVTLYG